MWRETIPSGWNSAVIRGMVTWILIGVGAGLAASEPPPVFEMPSILTRRAENLRQLQLALTRDDDAEVERQANEILQLIPFDPDAVFHRLRAQARQGKSDEALNSLEQLLGLGVRNMELIRSDPRLAGLRSEPRFLQLLENPPPGQDAPRGWTWPAEAASPRDGQVLITSKNTSWSPQLNVFLSYFDLSTPRNTDVVSTERGTAGELLRGWYRDGSAAGHLGDLYDNCDGSHSLLDTTRFPQLTRIRYGNEVEQRNFHRGLQTRFLFLRNDPPPEAAAAAIAKSADPPTAAPTPAAPRAAVVLGNSSMAVVDPLNWRSLPRIGYSDARTAQLLYVQYTLNHLYIYPEHRDHDPGHNGRGEGHGDVFPANTPYLLISQGSSGSDQPLLQAVALTLAAFRPDVKQFLAANQALMPAVQMLFRRSYRAVASDQDYLTGLAHPTVFDGGLVDPAAMVTRAHAMERGSEPPLARLQVTQEDQPLSGRDFFHAGADGERLFDTPAAIARVYRTTQSQRRMVVSAEGSQDLNGRPLTFHWVILRGDPERIAIRPLDSVGSRAELTVGHHERRPIRPGSKLDSNRVDIGVFVHNGRWHSAPALVTFFFLDNERRVYDERGAIQVVEYGDQNYVDPLVDVPKLWRDEYRYDANGKLLGWTRHRSRDGAATADEFTAAGHLVLASRPASADAPVPPTREVEYFVTADSGKRYLDYRLREPNGNDAP